MNHADRISIKFIPDTGDTLLFSTDTAQHLTHLVRRYNEVRGTKDWSAFWRELTQTERCAINYVLRCETGGFSAPFTVPTIEPQPARFSDCDPAILDELNAAVTYVQNLFVEPESFAIQCENSDFAYDLFLVERYVDLTQVLVDCKRDNRPLKERLSDDIKDVEVGSLLSQAMMGIEIALQHHVLAHIEECCSARIAA